MIESKASVTDLLDLAGSLTSTEPDAPELRCSHCAEQVDSFALAYDDSVAVIRRFLEHCAFEHSGRADVLVLTITRRIAFSD